MASQDSLLARVEKLERQNRRMKLIGFGSLIVAGAILLMGQAQPVRPGAITGTSFTLLDAQGRTRATLALYKGAPQLALFDADEKTRVTLKVSPDGQPGLALVDANENLRAGLALVANGPILALAGANEKAATLLEVSADGPQLNLSDVNGFQANIGVMNLETPTTGETHKTSAASIVLLGKDKTVLWSAP